MLMHCMAICTWILFSLNANTVSNAGHMSLIATLILRNTEGTKTLIWDLFLNLTRIKWKWNIDPTKK